jgi:hypothetical protein
MAEKTENLLHTIQQNLEAPKNQWNKFGKYSYRKCEDILDAVKPYLKDGATLIISDDIIEKSGQNYVQATATLRDGTNTWQNTAYAREAETLSGMSAGQITGATSSYARKYALNGLFLIDDNKDADSQDNRGEDKTETPKAKSQAKPQTKPKTQGKPKVEAIDNKIAIQRDRIKDLIEINPEYKQEILDRIKELTNGVLFKDLTAVKAKAVADDVTDYMAGEILNGEPF